MKITEEDKELSKKEGISIQHARLIRLEQEAKERDDTVPTDNKSE